MKPKGYNHIIIVLMLVFLVPGIASSNEQLVSEGTSHFNIGIITDGPLPGAPNVVKIFQEEIKNVAEEEYSVSFPDSMTLEADATVAGINKQLDLLLNNPDADLIITLGPISSAEAVKRSSPVKPIIAPLIIDTDVQKAPRQDLGSGVPNLTYVDIGNSVETELMSFRKMASFKTLGIILDERDIKALPDINRLAKTLMFEHSISVHLIPSGQSGEETLASIPDDTDAVMLGPLWQLTSKEFAKLSKGLIDRKLASFSMWGRNYVEQGIFATNMPSSILEHLARKVSIIVQEILLGEDVASLPVSFSMSKKLSINMATARAINVYPSLAITVGAQLLNEQRQDIERSLNLTKVVQAALAANLDLAAAEQKIVAGAYAVDEAKSVLLPQVGIGAGGRVIDEDRARLGQGISPEQALIGSAAASQVIYSESGWAGYTIEKYQQSGREYDRDTVRLDIVYDSSVSYLNVLRQKTIEQLQKENLQLTQANLERSQIRLDTGVAGPDELYRWQTKFANDSQVVLKAESDTLDAMQNLNRLLYRPLQEEFMAEEMDLSDPLLITGNQLFSKLMQNPLYLRDFNQFAIEESLSTSPELKTFDSVIAIQERLIVKSKRDYWVPTISLQGNIDQYLSTSGEGQREEELCGLDDTEWSVGLYATLPLF
jgi:outer membrane protein